MRILWISNIVFPEANELLNHNSELTGSGGWILGAAQTLVLQPNLKLAVASVSASVDKLTRLEGKKIRYYLLPYGKGNQTANHSYEPLWKHIYEEFQPDVVHIHGTELTHGLAYIQACGTKNVCISIQGLISSCYEYYFNGLSKKDIIHSTTFSSLLLGGIYKNANRYKQRGEYEKEMIRSVSHIIGRTTWDKERIWCINPQAKYYSCNETLRAEFYSDHHWNYYACQKHSIFMSQAGQTIKGLHMLLRAFPLILKQYPDTILRVAGSDIITCNSLKQRLLLSDYGNLLRKLIKKNHLEERVCFTGPLNGMQMMEEYLKSNVFVCPSSIENSPNSIGEAQLLGVPVVAAYVGGVPDMMRGNEDKLYRFEEVGMLAYKICDVFSLEDSINTDVMRRVAFERHNPQQNVNDLIQIYNKVINYGLS